MALELFKLFVGATTTTDVVPTDSKFFFVNPAPVAGGADLTVAAEAFTDDAGTDGVTLPDLTADNSYFKVYINGVLQQNANSTYTPGGTGVGSLVFTNPPGADPILAGQPVMLEVVNFAPTSDTTVIT